MKTLEAGTRIDIKNVLFLTDFSKSAAAAAPYAASVAKRFAAHLVALHVQVPVVNPMTEPTTWDALEKASEAMAAQERETLLRSFPGLHPKILIEEGSLWSTLDSVIESEKIDLIVLGTRGRSGLAKFFLGSTAEEIFRRSACPVLTVGPHSATNLAGSGQFSEILFATDFSAESLAAAPYALSLARDFQAHLTLLHVIGDENLGAILHPDDVIRHATRRLQEIASPDAEDWCKIRFAVEKGRAAEKILEVAAQRKADLIVLGLRRPGAFPGADTHLPVAVAHQVVTHASCPVLTVRG